MSIPDDVVRNVIAMYLCDEEFSWSALYGVCRSWHSIYGELLSNSYCSGGNPRIFGSLLETQKGTMKYPLTITRPPTCPTFTDENLRLVTSRSLKYPWFIMKYGLIHVDIPQINMNALMEPQTEILCGLDSNLHWREYHEEDVSPVKICKVFLRNYPLYSWQMKEYRFYEDEDGYSRPLRDIMEEVPEFIDCLVCHYLYMDLMIELGYSQPEDHANVWWILPSNRMSPIDVNWLVTELTNRDLFVQDFVEEFASNSDPWLYIDDKYRLSKLVTKRSNNEIRQTFKTSTNPQFRALFE